MKLGNIQRLLWCTSENELLRASYYCAGEKMKVCECKMSYRVRETRLLLCAREVEGA